MMHLDGRSGQDRQKASSIKTLSLMQQFLKAQMTGVIFQATESRICHHHRLLEWMSCGNRPEIVGGQACTGTWICQPMNVYFEPCSMSDRMCHVPSWSLQIPVWKEKRGEQLNPKQLTKTAVLIWSQPANSKSTLIVMQCPGRLRVRIPLMARKIPRKRAPSPHAIIGNLQEALSALHTCQAECKLQSSCTCRQNSGKMSSVVRLPILWSTDSKQRLASFSCRVRVLAAKPHAEQNELTKYPNATHHFLDLMIRHVEWSNFKGNGSDSTAKQLGEALMQVLSQRRTLQSWWPWVPEFW